MKQKDIIVGNDYLFHNTDVEHRRDMIGSVVTIVGKKNGKITFNIFGDINKNPIRYKLSNNRWANASELKEIML